MHKFLLTGLGNPGLEYADTRHNIGFLVLDTLASKHKGLFKSERYGYVSEIKIKGKTTILLKPNTFMNLSGKAVRYWLTQEKISPSELCIIADDVALPFGAIRMKPSGSDGGHNGLKSIQELLQTQQYPRLRWGIGNDYPKGKQADYVLGKWTNAEIMQLQERIDLAVECLETFVGAGLQYAMNNFNNK
jgi:peptidyl-tRNA hydrolase, PTH1 family